MQNNYLTSGLSYDMRKFFDTIPVCLVLQIFNHRGADDNVVRAMTGFYKQHQFFFRIDGAYSKVYRPHNGIIQGCPLIKHAFADQPYYHMDRIQPKQKTICCTTLLR